MNTYIYKENLIRKKEYRLKYELRQDSIVILFSGRFEHVKGIIEFTKAVKKIIKNKGKDIEVVIVGSGTLENDIKSILHDTDNIHLLGWQSPDHIHEIYIASDIFVNPSKFEGLPITIIEAMNACLHIVYTPVGGVPDILQGYSPKTMLTKTSSDEIQNVLSTLLDRYNSLSTTNNIGNSFAYAQKFDWNNIAYQVNCVYKELRL